MGKETNIEWCDSTINGTSGCDGCELWNGNVRICYAGTLHESRLAKTLPKLYAANFNEVRMIPGRFAAAANWSDLRGKNRPDKPWLNGKPRHIFVGDMGDFLSRAVTDEYLERELLGAIMSDAGRRHVWMLLTKHPKRLAELSHKWGGLPDNCIAMTTITDQRTADARIPWLLQVKCAKRGISAEPLLGPVDLNAKGWLHELDTFDWLIAGGASGQNAPTCNVEWIRSIVKQCGAAEVPCFVKQDSGRFPGQQGRLPNHLWAVKETT